MKKTVLPLTVLTILVSCAPAFGNDLSESARMSDILNIALADNPSIKAARENWRAIVEEYRVVTGYPEPQFMVTYFPEPIETRLGPQDWNASLSQAIPFPGKLTKAGELVRSDAEIAKLKLDRTVRDVTLSLVESCHELSYIRAAKIVAAYNAELLDHLRKVGETAYAQDRAVFMDVVKAQAQTAQLRYDMLLLDELESVEIAKINGLLNRAPDSPVGRLEAAQVRPLAFTLDEIYRQAEIHRQEILMAGAMVEKAEKKVGLMRYKNLPDFKVGLFYAGIGEPDMAVEDAGRDAMGVQFGMKIPIWFGKNSGRTESALAGLAKAKADRDKAAADTRTAVRSLYFRVQNARRLVELYGKELLPQAEKSMALAETWFREGDGSFTDFTEAQSTLYNFNLALARAKADYGKFLAQLERTAGTILTEKPEGAEVSK